MTSLTWRAITALLTRWAVAPLLAWRAITALLARWTIAALLLISSLLVPTPLVLLGVSTPLLRITAALRGAIASLRLVFRRVRPSYRRNRRSCRSIEIKTVGADNPLRIFSFKFLTAF
jgi:hypothetical protein